MQLLWLKPKHTEIRCVSVAVLHWIASLAELDLMCFLCLCVLHFSVTHCNVVVFQLVFEALHSQEPRGYVVGWIIAISLLVGILIFLLLAVLLWKVNQLVETDCGFSAYGTGHHAPLKWQHGIWLYRNSWRLGREAGVKACLFSMWFVLFMDKSQTGQ